MRHLAAERPDDRETQVVTNSLVYLGRFRKNPAFPKIKNPGGALGYFYTCRHFDKKKGDCKIYRKRPFMCHRYPNYTGCQYQMFYECDCQAAKAMRKTIEEGKEFIRRLHEQKVPTVALMQQLGDQDD